MANGAGGRPRKPTAIKELLGTAAPSRTNKHEPKPALKLPPCPAWLSLEGKREWRRMAPLLLRLGVMTEADGSALAAYCQSWARWRQSEMIIEEKGFTVETWAAGLDGELYLTGVKPRPEVAISQKERMIMRSFLVGFGLDPASRSKIVAAPPPTGDPFEEFLSRGRRSS